MKKRKSSLKSMMKKADKVGESLQGVVLNSNPKIASLELQVLGIAERVKKEGIQ